MLLLHLKLIPLGQLRTTTTFGADHISIFLPGSFGAGTTTFLDGDERRLFELAPSMGLGSDEKGGGGGRRVGLILLFQCGGRRVGGGGGR